MSPQSLWNGYKWDDYVSEFKVTPAEIEVAKKSCGGGGKKKTGGGSSYKPCSGTYTRGCKSSVVKQVQVCLGMVPKYHTGNFGPITQGELRKLGKGFENGFTDADIDKICAKKEPEKKDDFGTEIKTTSQDQL